MAEQNPSTPPTTPTSAQPPAPQPVTPAAASSPAAAQSTEAPLGEPGLRALQAERDARANAERALREERSRREALEREKESESERLKREADEGRRLAATASTSLKESRLITALAGKGLTGPKAQAAARLLDGVEFDDAYRPTNLDACLDAAKTFYGAEVFTGAPVPAPTPEPAPTPTPTLANGARTTPDQQEEDRMFEAYMRTHFPGVMPQRQT